MSIFQQQIIDKCQNNKKIMLLWQGSTVPEDLHEIVKKIQVNCEGENKVIVENTNDLSMDNYTKSSFDMILCNVLTPEYIANIPIVTYLTLLKPNGQFIHLTKSIADLESEFKLNGFKNISVTKNNSLIMFCAEKPNFEIGASSTLKFKSKTSKEESKKVWKFTENDINEEDLINTDDLLDDLDFKKPEVQIRDCGTSKDGKKKACKGCVCGLAEEIEAEAAGLIKKNQTSVSKSACGSCFLGDAFRCASCPYLGMPAFKAGEKIQMTETLLKADI